MGKYAVKRVGLGPVARFGCLLGGVVMCLPSLLCSLAGRQTMVVLRRWLERWPVIELGALGWGTRLDFVELLRLSGFLDALRTLTDASWLVVVAWVVVVSAAGGLLVALLTLLIGLAYNLLALLTGGVVIELQDL
jgi:hypothetical protein